MKRHTAALLLALCCPGPGFATPAEDLFSQGVKAYDQGNYPAAAQAFEQLAQTVASGDVLYDLGNAQFRAGRLGEATAAYLAARTLKPRDPDIRANLRLVNRQVRDNVSVDREPSLAQTVAFWIYRLSERELLLAFSTVFGLGWLTLAASLLLSGEPRRYTRTAAWVTIGCGLFLGASWLAHGALVPIWGAVTQAEAQVRSGPGTLSPVLFVLHEGAPFMVLEQEEGWAKIELSDGKRGWVGNDGVRIWQPGSGMKMQSAVN